MSALDIFMLGLGDAAGELGNSERELWFRIKLIGIARAEMINANGVDPMSVTAEVVYGIVIRKYEEVMDEVTSCVMLPLDCTGGGMYMDIFVTECRDLMLGDEDRAGLPPELPTEMQDFIISCGHLSIHFAELRRGRELASELTKMFAEVPGFSGKVRLGAIRDDGTLTIL